MSQNEARSRSRQSLSPEPPNSPPHEIPLPQSPLDQDSKDGTHIVLLEELPDEDSGISESASEDSALIIETVKTPNGSHKKEKLLSIFVQIFIPFLIAGGGMMLAGMLLDHVQVN